MWVTDAAQITAHHNIICIRTTSLKGTLPLQMFVLNGCWYVGIRKLALVFCRYSAVWCAVAMSAPSGPLDTKDSSCVQ
ncbi:hypothetical protein XENTR_v10024695 [Xenopus tropicalis]|nr:hypothetical protein XENTR_v10024695 [Xenopus tropicalis]